MPSPESGAPHDYGYGTETIIAHLGEEDRPHGAVVPPIYQNSLFTFERTEDLLHTLEHVPMGPPHGYSRLSNPTVHLAEQKIAALEKTESCRLVGSGMAALTTAVMSAVRPGAHVVIPDTAYGPVRITLANYLSRYGVDFTFVTGTCVDEVLEAIRPETTVMYLETPSSALFRMQDVPTIAAECKARGITTIIDNTYASPILMNPAEMGVDLVCHSATKYLGGHSDITAGAICGTKERMESMTRNEINIFGNLLHPHPAWLLNRGLRTLPLRMRAHEASGNRLAEFLEDRPEVAQVHHVGLANYAQRDLFLKLMRGSGGLFSFEPKVQDRAKVMAFCDLLRFFGRGISWGGFESLVVPIRVQPMDYKQPRWVIRLFAGLETVDDLLQDLEQALAELR